MIDEEEPLSPPRVAEPLDAGTPRGRLCYLCHYGMEGYL